MIRAVCLITSIGLGSIAYVAGPEILIWIVALCVGGGAFLWLNEIFAPDDEEYWP